MELRQLRYFVAVVEEGGFTRAAERLRLAQPGLSAQIRQLERELGQPLLDRSGRAVRPTEVGEAVLPYARAALAAVEGVRQTAEEYTGLLRGRVAIGLVPGTLAHAFDLAGLLAAFHRAHPGVEVTLTEDVSDRMLAALRGGALDLAVAGVAGQDPPPGIAWEVVIDEPLVVAAVPDHPLMTGHPGARAVAPAALDGHRLIGLPHGTGMRTVLDRLCAGAGFRPHIAFEAATPDALARLAARGLGVAVLPGRGPRPGLRTLALADPRARGRVALAWRTPDPLSPAARELLRRLRQGMRAER
ncbi:DNA-binding transcriptional regulator, LysR family [Streptomyces misionensis]|uniref:DNA-binding transcriptional regulator, LysR family n=1 Tax=Streptomyces misionensis TaxID=67331 RepID=A0A1H5GL69_9ACTN|nr:LysR substrate-binding domain-containing protein [Streptomyces misionensis]SEE16285.1 DNA-binding transcriptional regulator, LysR family [Streptomyces misionensis]